MNSIQICFASERITEDVLRFCDIRWKVPANSGANLYTETWSAAKPR